MIEHEEWRPIPGWPYEASSLGRVRRTTGGCSTHAGRICKALARHERLGYYQVRLSRGTREDTKTFCVHQLVALAFMGPLSAGYHVNHKNCDKTDNRAANLEYITAGDNVRHARANGHGPRPARGDRSGQAKLTWELVREIRSAPPKRGTVSATARRLGVDRNTLYSVLNGATWKE